MNSKTSISDYQDYRVFCEIAAEDDEVFSNFRRNVVYNMVLDHLGKGLGDNYLEQISTYNPNINFSGLDKFKINDDFGNPRLYMYGKWGAWSPSTLQYIKIMTEMLKLFGSLEQKTIVEIGGGYGGQCSIINTEFDTNYHIWDLPEPLKLTEKYLQKLNINAILHNALEIGNLSNIQPDLIISNYSFSELVKESQNQYLPILKSSKNGYMIYNDISQKFKLESYSAEEISAILNGKTIEEIPSTYKNNKVVIW